MSSKKTATAKKEDTPALVPKLRFPEFRNDREWEETRLGRLGELVSGLTYSPDDVRESGLLVLRSSNVQNGEIALDDNVYVTPAIRGANLSQPNDIVICVRNGSKALIGKCALIPDGMPLCTHGAFMTVFRAKSPRFVFQLFQTKEYQKQVAGDLGATINSINGTQLLKYKFFVPTHPEQDRVAECLSSADELIAAQARKVDALRTHKKGLMQQLFPREGETQPRLRFPEFRDDGEWELQTLDELAHYENGKAHENDIAENGRYIVVNSRFISTEGEVRKFSNEGFCVADEGDVLMVLSDVPNGRAIAKCFYVDSNGLYTVNQRICRIKPTKGDSWFLFYSLDRNSHFLAFDDGIKQTNLRKEDVLACPLCIPPKKLEQHRIASCLSSLDSLITAETEKLEALKHHKRGLMQQLFPSPDEATV